jgi:anti-sigma regulatory factor (Ser/Thr protein kinase)
VAFRRLLLWRSGDAVVCQVNDSGPGFADLDVANAGRDAVPASTNGGRGLWITRRVVCKLNIDTGADGTTITVSMPLP